MFDIGLQELVLIFVMPCSSSVPRIFLSSGGPSGGPCASSSGRATSSARPSRPIRDERARSCSALRDEPLPTETPTAAAADAGVSPDPVLSPEEGLKPDGEAAADVGEPYIAQRGAKLFHARTCTWVKRIAEPERVY